MIRTNLSVFSYTRQTTDAMSWYWCCCCCCCCTYRFDMCSFSIDYLLFQPTHPHTFTLYCVYFCNVSKCIRRLTTLILYFLNNFCCCIFLSLYIHRVLITSHIIITPQNTRIKCLLREFFFFSLFISFSFGCNCFIAVSGKAAQRKIIAYKTHLIC